VANLPPQKGLAHRASLTSGLGTIGGSSRGSPTAEARVPGVGGVAVSGRREPARTSARSERSSGSAPEKGSSRIGSVCDLPMTGVKKTSLSHTHSRQAL